MTPLEEEASEMATSRGGGQSCGLIGCGVSTS
jgi:hypothetical protein